MRKVIRQIQDWQSAGKQVAVATVVRAVGSTPRPVGARLLIASHGEFAGSVSGGCVEGAVIQEAAEVIASGQARLLHYGITEEMSWEVGLACGGAIDVLIQRADPSIWNTIAAVLARNEACVLITAVSDKMVGKQAIITGEESPTDFSLEAVTAATAMLSGRSTAPEIVGEAVLAELLAPQPQLIIFGGGHIAIPLARMAQVLGFQVTIADPRSRFANRDRFPEVDRILVEWPEKALAEVAVDGRSAIAILTHDPKIDEPALAAALETSAFYIGAIGSRKTHIKRYERMAQRGVTAAQLQRVHGPVGLDIGRRTPEEIALSILAEIIAIRNGRNGGFLKSPF